MIILHLLLAAAAALAEAYSVNPRDDGGERTDIVSPLGTLISQGTSFTSTENSLDSPHVLGISPAVYEWWWFDAESPDLNTSIVIAFFTASAVAFPLVAGLPDTSIVVNAKLPNGSTIVCEAGASSAVITSGGKYGNGAQGVWGDIGNFTVAPDLSSAEINIDMLGMLTPIRGSIKFESVCITGAGLPLVPFTNSPQIAPAHYPCTTNLDNRNNLEIAPHVGWSNAMPAASTVGEFEILGGEKFTVNGFGYHDKNWGDAPFLAAISTWYWGHVHFGPLSVVFFNGTTATGDPFADAYVAKDRKVLVSSCQIESALVEPTLDLLGNVESVVVRIALPDSGLLTVNIIAESTNIEYPAVYSRYLISASGGEGGQEQYTGGVGTLEHFSL